MSKKNKSMRTLQSIRGMHDILPQQTPAWQDLEDRVRHLFAAYGYAEIRMPLVETSALFSRSIGEVTDIVEKEMYSFEDRNGELLSLRPEGTASCVRAGIQHGLFYNQRQRLWYTGPMFRRERPQKGRYRQFHQIGVETFGMEGPDIDAELILMTARFWQELGLETKDVRLELNSLGSLEARLAYREKLVAYFSAHHDVLDEDSKRRLNSNPLRILDSKNPALKEVIAQAPSLLDHLDDASREHFANLQAILDDSGVSYVVNPQLVRGLDYYSRTVFEWKTDLLGAQGTVCAGGRYDGLITQLGGRATPACGFAMGVERLLELREALGIEAASAESDAYLVLAGSVAQQKGLKLAEDLRDALPQMKLLVNCGGGSFKSQMKRADKSGAAYALILGEDEIAKQQIAVKPLRTQNEQQTIAWSELADWLKKNI